MFRRQSFSLKGQILIESQWNLNKGKTLRINDFNSILIESQWNLNMIADLIISFVISILIESQWNLNKFVSVCMFAVLHINRITVEFKFT